MSTIKANAYLDAAGGNTATINGAVPAPLASPALTGTPTAPTASVATNTTQLATTAFVLANTGGMTLLGTLTTTSGTAQTLSSLVLTGYKQLVFEWNNVSAAAGTTAWSIGTGIVMTGGAATDRIDGMVTVSLVTGVASTILARNATVPNGLSGSSQIALTGYSTATTSVSVSVTGSTFDSGSITVYGVK